MIKFDETCVGVWFVQTTETQDWMAGITEIEPDKKYEINYRFRYYNPESEDPWDGKDKKNWYKGTASCTREYAIQSMRVMVQGMKMMGAIGEPGEVVNNGDYNDFMERFVAQPWVHAKKMEPGEVN